ncbi:cell filamentation protein Fic [Haloprofundus marisrubri]|uniref:Cell filamentation protein Fic n=1 Tax=Haloprofundus marisrubri TaxID=1514971 RepID=A0A0W1R6F6_9EURY|nr:Fic/DOC family N-terminal domain-containing protein [Haloprofundus marisrubri]KTG09005.1 cell filamentation protein Fic [Haloprofundus marisrubri]
MIDGYDLPPNAPGQYLPLREDQRLPKAYFPDKLPPRLDLSDEVIVEHGRAMWALGRLEGLGSEIDNPGAVFSSFVYKEAEQSSRVEGTAVTVSDIYRYDVDQLTFRESAENDYEADVGEARNYIHALDEAVSYLRTAGFNRSSLTVELIKQLHRKLLEQGRSDDEDPLPGQFRPGFAVIEEDIPRGFGTRVRFVPPKPDTVVGLMEDLQRFIQGGNSLPTLIDVAVAHYQFETVHPFKDGNGRVGRILVVLMLIAGGLLHYPLLSLSAYIERRRTEYTDLLLAVSEEGKWDEWLLFFLRGIREQAEEAFVRAKLLINTRQKYVTEYAEQPKSVRSLALSLFKDPYFTVREASERIDVVYQTANNAVDRLEADGVVTEITGNKQNRVFRAEEIMDLVERPAKGLPDAAELIDVEHAWNLPDRPL